MNTYNLLEEFEKTAARVAASEARYAAAAKAARSEIIVKNWSYDPAYAEEKATEKMPMPLISQNVKEILREMVEIGEYDESKHGVIKNPQFLLFERFDERFKTATKERVAAEKKLNYRKKNFSKMAKSTIAVFRDDAAKLWVETTEKFDNAHKEKQDCRVAEMLFHLVCKEKKAQIGIWNSETESEVDSWKDRFSKKENEIKPFINAAIKFGGNDGVQIF